MAIMAGFCLYKFEDLEFVVETLFGVLSHLFGVGGRGGKYDIYLMPF